MTTACVREIFKQALYSSVATMLKVSTPEWVAMTLRDAADAVENKARKEQRWNQVEANTHWFGGEAN